MSSITLVKLSTDALVEQFVIASLEQDRALLMEDIPKVNRLFDRLEKIETELKRRPGDQRRLLLALYAHPNPQVRVKAIKATLAVEPKKARRALEQLANARENPQSGEAGMCIWALDEGIFKPT